MIKIQTTTETIESKSGLLLAGKIAKIAGIGAITSAALKKAGTILVSLFGIMTEGKTHFESIGEKRGNEFFKNALDLAVVYAKETIRLYLQKLSADADGVIEQLRETSVKIIKRAPLHGLWIQGRHYLPVDIDTSVLDNSNTKKEGVSWTYQKIEGYQPIIAYVGKEGYMLDSELRPGSQHCQKGTPEFIKGLIGRLEKVQAGGRFLFRLDSGNDAWETLEVITAAGKGYYCIIKRNKRQENDETWLETAKQGGNMVEAREGKKVWTGITDVHPHKGKKTLEEVHCVYEVIEREKDKAGNQLLIPEIEVNLWWTNLSCNAEKVIELYHDHATSEQFHSELKSDMGIERLPSGKLAVNKILLAVAMNAYNALRLLGQRSIEPESGRMVKRKRLGKVIGEIISVGGKLVRHAGMLVLKISKKEPMLPVFLRLNAVLDSS